jgi:hypothetical protein
MIHTKHFTLAEAANMLPDLKIKLARIISLKAELDREGFDINRHHFFGGIGVNGSGKYPDSLMEMIESIQSLNSSGIILKGIDNGLIDLPHIRQNGEEVYLCFMLGEEDIKYWHRIEEGFAGRQLIEDL